jgi:hypothetical protein
MSNQLTLTDVAQDEPTSKPEGHWILTRSTLQTLTTNLDLNYMSLKAAKTYLSAYGATIDGATKSAFLRNLAAAVSVAEGTQAQAAGGQYEAA